MLKTSSRATVTVSGLQKTITVAVQQSSIACQPFVGVYIEHRMNHSSGANWSIKGIKYGRAPRATCDVALEEIVQNLQDRYAIEPGRSMASRMPITQAPDSGQHMAKAVSPLAAALKRISQRP